MTYSGNADQYYQEEGAATEVAQEGEIWDNLHQQRIGEWHAQQAAEQQQEQQQYEEPGWYDDNNVWHPGQRPNSVRSCTTSLRAQLLQLELRGVYCLHCDTVSPNLPVPYLLANATQASCRGLRWKAV